MKRQRYAMAARILLIAQFLSWLSFAHGANGVSGGLSKNNLDGGPRVAGSKVDRGAYKSNVEDSFILTVTNTSDAVPAPAGSLRAAINSANSNGGFNIITFDIGSGYGPHTITLGNPNCPPSPRMC